MTVIQPFGNLRALVNNYHPDDDLPAICIGQADPF